MDSQYWKDESYKRQQVLNLKDAGRILVPYSHSKQRRFISVDFPEVLHLCNLLEVILLHGIKIKEFQGIVPLWGLLERLEVLQPPCIALRNTVGAVSCAGNLRNQLSKGRGWIRQSLNSQNLDESLQFMISQTQWLSKFYYPEAILLSRDDSTALVAVVRSFKALSFAIPVDDATLNDIPLHLVKQLTVPAPVLPPPSSAAASVQSQQQQQAQGQAGGGFDSFLRSFEQGFDRFVSKVDSLLDTFQALDGNTPVVTATQQLLQPAIQEVRSLSMLFLDDSSPDSAVNSSNGGMTVPAFFHSTSLKSLITSEYRCAHAYLEPRLGSPTMALKLMNVISSHAGTPGLFRQRPPLLLIDELVRLVEGEKGPSYLPSTEASQDMTIAACCHVLITWLNQLPEPLLGFDHYEAYLATSSLIEEVPGERIRCLTVLVSDTPWTHRPVLMKLFALFGKCLEEKERNGLNTIALALLFGPCLLRPPSASNSPALTEGELLTISAVSSPVIELLINHAEVILKPLKEEQEALSSQLTLKANQVRAWQMALAAPLTLDYDSGGSSEEMEGLIRGLYDGLASVEALLLSSSSSSSSPVNTASTAATETANMSAILGSERWKTCAMLSASRNNKTAIAGELEDEAGGLLALQSLSSFLCSSSSDKVKAQVAAAFASSPRRRYLSLPLASLQVTHAVGEALGLLSSSAYANRTIDNMAPLQVLAKGPAWQGLFKDVVQGQQVMFDIGMMALDLAWKEVIDAEGVGSGGGSGEEMAAQALFKARSLLWEIISQVTLITVLMLHNILTTAVEAS